MKKRIFVFGTLGLSLSCCACWNLLGKALCSDSLIRSAVSDDTQYTAEVYRTACTLDSIVTVWVDIAPSRTLHLLGWRPDQAEVFWFYSDQATVLVDWLDTRTVVIDYSNARVNCDQIRNRTHQWRDVRIEYRGRCEPAG